jgi:hypothetical protein
LLHRLCQLSWERRCPRLAASVALGGRLGIAARRGHRPCRRRSRRRQLRSAAFLGKSSADGGTFQQEHRAEIPGR